MNNPKKKVLYTNFHIGYGGGHDTYILALIQNDKVESYVACPKTSDLYKKLSAIGFENLYAISFPGKLKELNGIISSAKNLAHLIDENKIDLVHSNGSPDNRMALYSRLFTKRKFSFVFTKHNTHPIKGLVSKFRFWHMNDAIIYVSELLYKSFSKNKEKEYIVTNGVDINKWRPSFYSDQNKINIVSIAGTSSYKRWDLMVKAIGELPDIDARKIKVTIAGPKPSADFINSIFGCDGVPDNIFFCGQLSDPGEILEIADVGFVLSDAIETISFACREMMSSGIPVIVSDYGGLPENIDHGKDGWVVNAGEYKDIVSVLYEVLNMSKDDLLIMKKKAREKAEIQFSIDEMIKKTNDVYHKTCSDNAWSEHVS